MAEPQRYELATYSSEPSQGGLVSNPVAFPHNDRFIPRHAVYGGMGTAFYCFDQLQNSQVVLKSLKTENAGNATARLRFLQEAVDWIYLGHHPYIVQAHSVELIGNPPEPYLVLACIGDGDQDPSLAAMMSRRRGHPLGFQRCVLIGWQIAQAMQFATGKIPGLVHRDIKPANILVDSEGNARLTDFGLALSVVEHRTGPETLQEKGDDDFIPAGSPPFVAPEQWRPGNRADQRVDIYALGTTLYKLITGTRCVKGNDVQSIRQAHLDGDLNPVPEQVPVELANIIRRCVARDTDKRYQSWADLIDALETCYGAMTGETLSTPTPADYSEDLHQAYIAIANAYLNLGLKQQAINYLEAIEDTILGSAEIVKQLEYLQTVALTLSQTGRYDQSINRLRQALALAQQVGDKQPSIELRSLLGDQLGRAGEEQASLEAHRVASEQAKELGDTSLRIMTLGNWANSCAQCGDPARARDIFLQQLAIPELEQDPVNHIACLTNLGFAEFESGHAESAVIRFEEAISLAERHNDVNRRSAALQGLCEVYLQKRDKNKAQHALQRFQDFSAEWHNPEAVQWAAEKLEELGA